MNIDEEIKNLILSKYRSLRAFALASGFPYSTLDTMLKRGVRSANLSSVFRLCDALGISADELSKGNIVPLKEEAPSRSYLSDIETLIAFTRRNKGDYTTHTIGGEQITEDELEILLDALELAVGIIKRNRGRSYNG